MGVDDCLGPNGDGLCAGQLGMLGDYDGGIKHDGGWFREDGRAFLQGRGASGIASRTGGRGSGHCALAAVCGSERALEFGLASLGPRHASRKFTFSAAGSLPQWVVAPVIGPAR